MILPLLHPITRYMDFLKNQYGLQITVHHLDIGLYFSYFAPYNIHGIPRFAPDAPALVIVCDLAPVPLMYYLSYPL